MSSSKVKQQTEGSGVDQHDVDRVPLLAQQASDGE
jgi:hypothetical protein